MNLCPICGKNQTGNWLIDGIAVCDECYHFFVDQSSVPSSVMRLSVKLDEYVSYLERMDDVELRDSLAKTLDGYASRCGTKLTFKFRQSDDALPDENCIGIMNNITTLDYIPCRKTVKNVGLVQNAATAFFKIKGGLTGILSMNSITLLGPVNKTLRGLLEKAQSLGGDSVVGVQMNVVETGEGGYTVFAIGNAVKTVAEEE